MISKVVKESTRITGLAVSRNPHHTLTVLYDKILRTLEKIPDSAAYKQHTKGLVQDRLKLVSTVKEPQELEKKINQVHVGDFWQSLLRP